MSLRQQEILSGGPPKDGIPAILKPKIVESGAVAHLEDSDAVSGVKIGNANRACPIKIRRRKFISSGFEARGWILDSESQ